MKVKKMYNEVLVTSIILNFFDSFLTAITVFSIIYFIMYFTRITPVIPIVFSSLFFIGSLFRKIKQNKILMIEKEYPNLRERLRTSYDNQGQNNSIVISLHKDIMKMMKKVDVNTFLNVRKLSFKVIATCFILFSILYFSSIGLDVLDIKTRIVHSALYDKIVDTFDIRQEISDRPLLESPRLLALGSKELNVSVETYNTELDITEISAAEKNDFGGHYPDEVKGAAQELYDSKIPEEHKEVIKEYFKKINE